MIGVLLVFILRKVALKMILIIIEELQSTCLNVFICGTCLRPGENVSPLLFTLLSNDFEYTLFAHYHGLEIIHY